MSFLARAPVAALFVFALLSAALAQAPVQTSNQATARPPDNDLYSVRESAAAGDAQAQFALGNYYFSGVGVPQDYGQALLWFTKSGDQDFAPAQNQLGYMYQHKFGVPRDDKRAVAYRSLSFSRDSSSSRSRRRSTSVPLTSGLWTSSRQIMYLVAGLPVRSGPSISKI